MLPQRLKVTPSIATFPKRLPLPRGTEELSPRLPALGPCGLSHCGLGNLCSSWHSQEGFGFL